MYFQRRSHSRIALVVLVLTTGLLSASAVEATLINGRVSLVSYTWKPVSSPVNPEPETDMDMISRLSFNARRIGGSAWSIYFHGGLRGEVLNAPLKDLDGVVYRTRLEFAPSAHLNAGLGRMWVTSGGIGSTLIDGLQVRYQAGFGRLLLYGGSQNYLNIHDHSVMSWDDAGLVGGYYATPQLWQRLVLGVSVAHRVYKTVENTDWVGANLKLRLPARLLLAYEYRHQATRDYGYYSYLRVSQNFRSGSWSLNWNARQGYEPIREATYIFKRFQFAPWFNTAMRRPTDELRAHFSFNPQSWRGWRVDVATTNVIPEGYDWGAGWDLSVAHHLFRVGYRGRRGYGGNDDSMYANAWYNITRDLRLWFDWNTINYQVTYEDWAAEQPPDHWLMTSRLGADLALTNGWWFSGAFELLDHPDVKYDFRFLARIIYRFHTDTSAKGGS